VYGTRREHRSDETDAERDPAALDELAHDARLARCRRRIDIANELRQLLLRQLGSVDEAEDADGESGQRDQCEEDLEGDPSGEERALVGSEGGGDGAGVAGERLDRDQDAASLFGAGFSDAFVSDFLSLFVSPFVSVLVSPLASDFVSLFLSALTAPSAELLSAGRLSVLYQPDPLNTIAGAEMRRRGRLPQLGHFSSASSLNDWTAENTCPQ
jgi:hypothetical protein